MDNIYSQTTIVNCFVYNRHLFTVQSQKKHSDKCYYHTVWVERPDERGKIQFYLPPTYRLPFPSKVYRNFLHALFPLMNQRSIDVRVKEFNKQNPNLRLKYK